VRCIADDARHAVAERDDRVDRDARQLTRNQAELADRARMGEPLTGILDDEPDGQHDRDERQRHDWCTTPRVVVLDREHGRIPWFCISITTMLPPERRT